MLLLILLLSISIYCFYNGYINQKTDNDSQALYKIISAGLTFILIFVAVAAFAANMRSSAEFEATLQERAVLEHEAAHPLGRDYNYYEQVAAHNSTIALNQKYNQDWFITGAFVSDRWDSIEPIVLE